MPLLSPGVPPIESAKELLAHWRTQRAHRVGKIISACGCFLAALIFCVDLLWSPQLVVIADGLLFLGCVASWYLTKRSEPKPYFYWWPMYFGFWFSILPSVSATGGTQSPLLGVYLALLYIGGVIIQVRVRARVVAIFVLLQIPLVYAIEKYFDLGLAEPVAYPPFIFFMHVMGIATLGACVYALLRTEEELAAQFRDRYLELVSTRQELRKEEASNLAKTTFLANVSHELRTPLAAILGYGELLHNSKNLRGEEQAYLETLTRNSQQLAHLVDDLLDLTKIEAGAVEISKSRIGLGDLLTDILKQTHLPSEKKKIPVQVLYLNRIPKFLVTDPSRLRQILLNLVGNSIKFTDRGQVSIGVEYMPADNGGCIAIAVTDTGRGISSDEQRRLFKPFSQGDPSMARRYGGTGLGLSLSKKLASLIGGSLRLAQSETGAGSTFVLEVPVGVIEDQGWETKFQPTTTGNGAKKKVDSDRLLGTKVLFVDDVPDNQVLIQIYLNAVGAHVDTASNGAEGIEKALKNNYDIILMDIQMPVMDGYEAVARLRQGNYTKPILALTAHAMKEDWQKCVEAGCNGHLTKPIVSKDLVLAIEQALKHQVQ